MNLYSFILRKGDTSLQNNKLDLQKNKSEKYNKILNSAGAVFAEYGFYKATIAQISRPETGELKNARPPYAGIQRQAQMLQKDFLKSSMLQ